MQINCFSPALKFSPPMGILSVRCSGRLLEHLTFGDWRIQIPEHIDVALAKIFWGGTLGRNEVDSSQSLELKKLSGSARGRLSKDSRFRDRHTLQRHPKWTEACQKGSSDPLPLSVRNMLPMVGRIKLTRNDSQARSQVCKTNFGDIQSIDEDSAFGRFDESEE